MDFSEEMIARNRATMPHQRWHQGDIRAMPMLDSTFSFYQFDGSGGFFQYFFTQQELADAVRHAGFDVIGTGPATRPEPIMIWPDLALQPHVRRLLQLPAMCMGGR
jgi:hypothetical protein